MYLLNETDDGVQGLALLHWACDRGHEPMVRCLLDCGADVNIRVGVLFTAVCATLNFS